MLKHHQSQWRLEIYALILIIYLGITCTAAPTQENRIPRQTDGCYYNYNHYGEGDRITTNEPCLNCTCHNQMLMCYLRVCPFTKPIDHDCIIEKREDQCCPIITCPEVPVQLMDLQVTNTEVGHVERSGCLIDDKFYPEGRQVPANPNKPCELCYCIRNKTSCIMQECTLHIDGCQPIYNRGSCCPVRYNCDSELENDVLLEQDTTTVRPTQGFMITTPLSYMSMKDCIHNGVTYGDGSIIESDRPCEHCYCMKGDIVCAVQECTNPVGIDSHRCTTVQPIDNDDEDDTNSNECCPKIISCDVIEEQNKTLTTEYPEIKKFITTTTSKVTIAESVASIGTTEDTTTSQSSSYLDGGDKIIEGISSEDLQLQQHINEGYLNMNDLNAVSAATTVPTSITDSQEEKEKHITTMEVVATTEAAEIPEIAEASTQKSISDFTDSRTITYLGVSTDIPFRSSSPEETMKDISSTKLPEISDFPLSMTTQTNIQQEAANDSQSTDFSSPIINEIPDSIPGEGFCLVKGISYKSYDSISNDCNLPCICLNSLIVCKSNCNKSSNCPKTDLSCCNSIKCDYDLIEPLDNNTLDQRTESTLSFDQATSSVRFVSTNPPRIMITEKLGISEKKDTTRRVDDEQSASTPTHYHEVIAASTTENQPPEITDIPPIDLIEQNKIESLTVDHHHHYTPLTTESTMEFSASTPSSFEEVVNTSTEMKLMSVTTTEGRGAEELTKDSSSTEESHYISEKFPSQDTITEIAKTSSELTTQKSKLESVETTSPSPSPSSTVVSQASDAVFMDTDKATTSRIHEDEIVSVQQTTETERTKISPVFNDFSSEIPFKEQTTESDVILKKAEITDAGELTPESRPVTTVSDFSIDTTTAGDLIDMKFDNNQFIGVDDSEKESDILEPGTTVGQQQYFSSSPRSTESAVTEVQDSEKLDDEIMKTITAGVIEKESTESSSFEGEMYTTASNDFSSLISTSTEYEKAFSQEKHETEYNQMEQLDVSTKDISLTSPSPSVTHESTLIQEVQNQTSSEDHLEIEGESTSESALSVKTTNHIGYNISDTYPSTPMASSPAFKVSTTSPLSDENYISSTKFGNIEDITIMFTPSSDDEMTTLLTDGQDLKTQQQIFENVTDSSQTEVTVPATTTTSFKKVFDDHHQDQEPMVTKTEKNFGLEDDTSATSEHDGVFVSTKMMDNEVIMTSQSSSSLPPISQPPSTPSTVEFVPQTNFTSTSEEPLKPSSTEGTKHTEDHSVGLSPHQPSIGNDYLNPPKIPSYQQNIGGQFPPHYPSYSEDDYNEEEENESFGPGTCRYGGKLFVSAQQIPRDDPCDFCFCFRSDIICLQQSCPPPISGCHEEPISGFCCPRYECPVSMAAQLNLTTSTTTTTTLPPYLSHNFLNGGMIKNGCYIGGKSYKVGDKVDSTSGPCMTCRCGGDGQMKCEPKPCTPEPMLRQMIAVVASRRR